MAKSAVLTTDWADGLYTFRFNVPQLEEHDEKCKAGPMAVLGALVDGNWRYTYIRETIRLGLIGGGTLPTDAERLVRRYVDSRPMIEGVVVAIAIMGAAIRGEGEDDTPGKQPAAESESEPATTGSTSPRSEEMPA